MCIAAFQAIQAHGFDAKQSVPTIAADHPDCECERESASGFSIGPVGNDEIVCRLVFSPHHFDVDTSRAKPGLFEDAFSRGASAYRSPGLSFEEVHVLGREREEKNKDRGHGYIGFVAAVCRRIRDEIRHPADDETRRMCVYDTALEEQRNHVDVFCATAIGDAANDRSLRQALRNALVALFEETIELAPRPEEAP